MSSGGAGGSMPATTAGSYPDSVESSPRSRGGDSWTDEHYPSSNAPAAKLRFMCSYGGQIVPRPHDQILCYVGGETRMVVVDRYNTTLADLSAKLSRSLLSGRSFTLKYQLPSEDLDSLISVTTDEDLDNMIDEYDRLLSPTGNDPKTGGSSNSTGKQNRLRLFLFPSKPDSVASSSSIGSLLDDSKSDTWFVDVLNSAIGVSGGGSSVDSLLGFEEERNSSVHLAAFGGDKAEERIRMQRQLSPQLDTSSSFGSVDTGPSPSDLPPIRVRVEEQRIGDVGLESEESKFAQLSVKEKEAVAKEGDSGGAHYGHHFHPHTPPLSSVNVVSASASAVVASTVAGFSNCTGNIPVSAPIILASDDAKPEHGEITTPDPNLVRHQQPPSDRILPAAGGGNIAKQESQYALSDSSYRSQVSEQGYTIPMHPEQFQQHHPVQHLQQQIHQQRQRQQQQYIHINPQLAHQQAPTPVFPAQSHYQMNHPIQTQQQLTQPNPYNQQIPMYLVPIGQNQSYMIPMQQQKQSNLGDAARLAAPTNAPTMPILNSHVPGQGLSLPQSELGIPATAGAFRTNTGIASSTSQQHPLPSQFIQLGDQTHQYLGYHSVHHHPSQPAALSGGYRYDSVQPQQPTLYYPQTSPMQSPPQNQTMNSTPPEIHDIHQLAQHNRSS